MYSEYIHIKSILNKIDCNYNILNAIKYVRLMRYKYRGFWKLKLVKYWMWGWVYYYNIILWFLFPHYTCKN